MTMPAIDSRDGVNAADARDQNGVDGSGIVVAVLDSGCRGSHEAFRTNGPSRVLPGRNFTGGDVGDTEDRRGHGTAVAGIVAADGIAEPFIIAPRAKILPVKVISDNGNNKFVDVNAALSWILNETGEPRAHVVCLAIGDDKNHQTAQQALNGGDPILREISKTVGLLRARRIPTVVPAGNRFVCQPNAGMAFPAIMPQCLSVGAIFKDETGNIILGADYCHAHIDSSAVGRITQYSQRLAGPGDGLHYTRLFAPGSPIRSLWISSDDAGISAPLHGTSIAAPFVAGVVALLQQLYKKRHDGELPLCDDLEQWLLQGADRFSDTGAEFKALNALGAMEAMLGNIRTALWHLS